MHVSLKKKAVLGRIRSLEYELTIAQEYLEAGAHADWHRFCALFRQKLKDGWLAPPHRDWVKNYFIPSRERSIREAEKLLDRFDFD